MVARSDGAIDVGGNGSQKDRLMRGQVLHELPANPATTPLRQMLAILQDGPDLVDQIWDAFGGFAVLKFLERVGQPARMRRPPLLVPRPIAPLIKPICMLAPRAFAEAVSFDHAQFALFAGEARVSADWAAVIANT